MSLIDPKVRASAYTMQRTIAKTRPTDRPASIKITVRASHDMAPRRSTIEGFREIPILSMNSRLVLGDASFIMRDMEKMSAIAVSRTTVGGCLDIGSDDRYGFCRWRLRSRRAEVALGS